MRLWPCRAVRVITTFAVPAFSLVTYVDCEKRNLDLGAAIADPPGINTASSAASGRIFRKAFIPTNVGWGRDPIKGPVSRSGVQPFERRWDRRTRGLAAHHDRARRLALVASGVGCDCRDRD